MNHKSRVGKMKSRLQGNASFPAFLHAIIFWMEDKSVQAGEDEGITESGRIRRSKESDLWGGLVVCFFGRRWQLISHGRERLATFAAQRWQMRMFPASVFPFHFSNSWPNNSQLHFWINIWLVIKAVYLGCQCHSKSLLNFFMFLKPLLNWWSILIEPSPSQIFHSFWCEEKINQSLRLIDFFGRNSWNSSPWWMNSRI